MNYAHTKAASGGNETHAGLTGCCVLGSNGNTSLVRTVCAKKGGSFLTSFSGSAKGSKECKRSQSAGEAGKSF